MIPQEGRPLLRQLLESANMSKWAAYFSDTLELVCGCIFCECLAGESETWRDTLLVKESWFARIAARWASTILRRFSCILWLISRCLKASRKQVILTNASSWFDDPEGRACDVGEVLIRVLCSKVWACGVGEMLVRALCSGDPVSTLTG